MRGFPAGSTARVMTGGRIPSIASQVAFERRVDELLARAGQAGETLDALAWIHIPSERCEFADNVIDEAIRVLKQRMTDAERHVWSIFQQGEAAALYDVMELKHARGTMAQACVA